MSVLFLILRLKEDLVGGKQGLVEFLATPGFMKFLQYCVTREEYQDTSLRDTLEDPLKGFGKGNVEILIISPFIRECKFLVIYVTSDYPYKNS